MSDNEGEQQNVSSYEYEESDGYVPESYEYEDNADADTSIARGNSDSLSGDQQQQSSSSAETHIAKKSRTTTSTTTTSTTARTTSFPSATSSLRSPFGLGGGKSFTPTYVAVRNTDLRTKMNREVQGKGKKKEALSKERGKNARS